jgi:hypothetical protein
MANQNTIKAWTYDDAAIREDLLDVMTNIDPTEHNFQDLVGTASAFAVLHQWPTDTLDAPGDNAAVEGADASTASITNPTRVSNITQVFTKPYIVSGTEQSVKQAGFTDRKAYEISKKLKALKNDIEYALVRGSSVTGSGTNTASRLKGVKNFISTNSTAQSGVSLSEAILISYLSLSWAQGGRVDNVLVGSTLKQRISGFSGNNTRYVGADEKKLVNTINLYASDFGAEVIEVKLHRYVTVSGDVNADVLGIESDTWAVAWLRKPFNKDLAPTGDAEKGMLIAEGTLEARAEKANFQGLKHL